jgi:hypothetical protein
MDNEKLVVKAKRAKLGKTLLGGLQVVYPCPRCKDELTTKNDVSLGDTCPSCKASFEFESEIKDVFAKFEAQKKQQAEAQAAAQAEKERIRQAQQAQQAKAKAEAWAEEQWKRNVERGEAAERERKARLAESRSQGDAARQMQGAYGCVTAIIGFSALCAVLVILGSMMLLFSPTSPPGIQDTAIFYLIYGGSCLASLIVLDIFFRFLKALHGLLVAILDRLDSSSE